MCNDENTASAETEQNIGKQEDLKKLYEEIKAERDLLLAESDVMKENIKISAEEAARARADYYNLRMRVERDRARDCKLAAERSIEELLPVFENLERIFDAVEEKESNLYKGMGIIIKQFLKALERLGLEMIPTDGIFDPSLHEAVTTEPVEDKKDECRITETLRKGYKLAGRVVRASQVKVGKYQE